MDRSVPSSALHALLRRDRQLVLLALASVALLSWIYTLAGVGMDVPDMARDMAREATGDATGFDSAALGTGGAAPGWSVAESLLMLAMWWIMMIAMMLPSAAPMILLAAAINRRAQATRPPYGPTALFALGYLLTWLAFSLIALVAHWQLERSGSLDAMMRSSSLVLSAALLLGAGLWQLTPIKRACLVRCRSPIRFLVAHRRPGRRGALLMGMRHGTYCLGCCWMLMLLLFVGGVMSVLWIGGLALFVLVEKWWAKGESFGRLGGALLTLAGASILLYALLDA